jgi:hypothetical protein
MKPTGAGNGAAVSQVQSGQPVDGRFLGMLTFPQGTNCNTLAANASKAPNVREARQWSLFDVRR